MSSTPPRVSLPTTSAVRLVAERELRTRLRSKAYRVTTVVLVVVVVVCARSGSASATAQIARKDFMETPFTNDLCRRALRHPFQKGCEKPSAAAR